MTKRDLSIRISDETSLTQAEVLGVIQGMLDAITNEVSAGRSVELRNFGVFHLAVRKSRVGRNPMKPKDEVTIPERTVVKFKMGKVMGEKVGKLKALDII